MRTFPFGMRGGAPRSVLEAGWSPDRDAGVDGTWYVSDVSGDDASGDGSLARPWATIGHAIQAARRERRLAGRILRVRAEPGGGVYRERLDLTGLNGRAGAPFVISGYGREKPTIAPTKLLDGWTRCGSGDAPVIGPNYASVFKTRIDTAALNYKNVGGVKKQLGMNLCERGEPAPICTDRADPSDLFFQNNYETFHEADQVLNDSGVARRKGDGYVREIVHPRVLGKYTAEQLKNGFARVHRLPNYVTISAISEVRDGAIRVAEQEMRYQSNYYALTNVLPSITRGAWGFKDEGDGATTVYFWPKDEASLSGGVEISIEPVCIYAEASYIRLQDLRVVQAGGMARYDSTLIGRNSSGGARPLKGREFFNLYFGNLGQSGYGASGNLMARESGLRIENITVENCSEHFGFNIYRCSDVRIGYVRAHRVGKAPLRMLAVEDAFVAYLHYTHTGRGAHSNLLNFYAKSKNCWVHALVARDTKGYLTFQDSEPVHFTMCDVEGNAAKRDSRVLADQSGGERPALNFVWNCWFTFNRTWMDGNGVVLGNERSRLRFDVRNSIFHGGGVLNLASMAAQKNNIFTALAWWQKPDRDIYPGRERSNTIATDLSRVYVNARRGDFTPARASPIVTKRAAPMAPLLEALEADFPDLDVATILGHDVLGAPIDLDAPPMGPYARPRNRIR